MQYHLIILALVNQVLIMSANKPNAKMKKICLKESGNPDIIREAGKTAVKAVIFIRIPVLNAPKILWFVLPPFFLKALEVNRISVSTEQPINIKNAEIPAAYIRIPKMSINANGMTISEKAAKITAMLGVKVLNEKKTTTDINANDINKAIKSC